MSSGESSSSSSTSPSSSSSPPPPALLSPAGAAAKRGICAGASAPADMRAKLRATSAASAAAAASALRRSFSGVDAAASAAASAAAAAGEAKGAMRARSSTQTDTEAVCSAAASKRPSRHARSAGARHGSATASCSRAGSQPWHCTPSPAAQSSAEPSGVNSAPRSPEAAGGAAPQKRDVSSPNHSSKQRHKRALSDTSAQVSRSHTRAVRSADAVASRNSCGWKLPRHAPRQHIGWCCALRMYSIEGTHSTAVTPAACGANSTSTFPAARSHSWRRTAAVSASGGAHYAAARGPRALTAPSCPPETTHRPSGLNATLDTPRLWPRKVCTHPRRRTSQILRHVSSEPDAKNSPAPASRRSKRSAHERGF